MEVGIRDVENQTLDEVVVTTPLGWLKGNRGAFEPPIHDDLLTSIDVISIGHLEKVTLSRLLKLPDS